MSIQIVTTDMQVNRYSDFKLTMSLTKNGEAYIPASFMIVFYVDSWDDCEGRYVASYINGEYNNCVVSGTTINVYFDSPGFNLGQLKCRVLDMVENDNFTDGTLDTCTPITLPVEIVAGPGNTDNVVLGFGRVFFDEHDLVLQGASAPSFGNENNLEI